MTIPFFSIVIPTYNRQNLVIRAVNSVINQDFHDFEVIVVDDGSTDKTVENITNIDDERISIVTHEINSGVSVARNTGINKARGIWILTLDSDDELLQNSLSIAYEEAIIARDDIGMIRFLNQLDDGTITPIPPLEEAEWNFEDYIKWNEKVMNSSNTDSCKIIRKKCFERVQFPIGRALESEFHFNFAYNFNIKCKPIPLILVHTDAMSRLSSPSPEVLRLIANDTVNSNTRILEKYGKHIKSISPKLYNRKLSSTAFYCFISKRKRYGFKLCYKAIINQPLQVRNWSILIGLISPSLLIKLKTDRQKHLKN
jgi:glycosyltransferase involved in cell wall biosynthesis